MTTSTRRSAPVPHTPAPVVRAADPLKVTSPWVKRAIAHGLASRARGGVADLMPDTVPVNPAEEWDR